MSGCYVYIICHVERRMMRGPVKVGVSANPWSRMATFQTANPQKLAVAFAFLTPDRHAALSLEGAFHSVLADHALEGEWFDVSPIRAMESMCRNIRAHLETCAKLSGEELDVALEMTGVREAENLIEACRVQHQGAIH